MGHVQVVDIENINLRSRDVSRSCLLFPKKENRRKEIRRGSEERGS